MKIIENKVQCRICKDVIISRSRRDLQVCKCGAILIEGGFEYLRRGGSIENIIELSTYIKDEEEDKL
jgi:hypothetical protein